MHADAAVQQVLTFCILDIEEKTYGFSEIRRECMIINISYRALTLTYTACSYDANIRTATYFLNFFAAPPSGSTSTAPQRGDKRP